MEYDFNGLMDKCREMADKISEQTGMDMSNLFPRWEFSKACRSFDTNGNDYQGLPLVIHASPSGGPVFTSGDGDTTEDLVDRWKSARLRKASASELLSITYALHLHCL